MDINDNTDNKDNRGRNAAGQERGVRNDNTDNNDNIGCATRAALAGKEII